MMNRIVITIFLTLCSLISLEAKEEVFLIEGVKVSADAKNLDDAKAFAEQKGVVSGFKRLYKRLTPYTLHEKLSQIKEREIFNTADKFVPDKERMTNHSYQATLDITFNKDKIKKLLNKYGIIHGSEISEEIRIFPFLYNANMNLSTIWRDLWFNYEGIYNLLSIDVANSIINHSIYQNDYIIWNKNMYQLLYAPLNSDLMLMQSGNGSIKHLIVVFAELNNSDLEFTIREIKDGNSELKYLIESNEILDKEADFIEKSLNNLVDKIDAEYKGVNLFKDKIIFDSNLFIKVPNPKFWSVIERRLSKIKNLYNYDVVNISDNIMQIKLKYNIPSNCFKELLLDNGLEIVYEDNKYFLNVK